MTYANFIKHIFDLHTHFFASYTSYNPTNWGIL
nr:MAG TPA: 2-amino-3-carboxymuconate 6-semialdehyde decarboxylase [Caudoviricetes sp.]